MDGNSYPDRRGAVHGDGSGDRERAEGCPDNAVHVTVIGHQFWWEYRYPGLKVVTANELHIPVGAPTEIKLLPRY